MSDLPEDEIQEPVAAGRPGIPVDPVRILRSLSRQWRWIAAVAAISSLVGVALAKTIAPKTYTARSVIVWEPGPDPRRQDLSTLIDSMLIPSNLNEVKRRLGLKVPLDALSKWLEVYFDPQSDVIAVEASAGTAKEAMRLADTMIAVFLDHCQHLKRARKESELQEARANLDVARATLTTAQEVYDTFRRENNVTDVSAESALAIQEAAALRSQAEAARSEAQAESARARLLDENARHQSAMVVTGQSQSDPNTAALALLEMELQQARARLSADHPRVAALEAQIQALRSSAGTNVQTATSTGQNAQLAAIKTSLASSATARAAALERQQSYAEYAAKARERLQKLSAIEGQAAVLLSEVTNASSHVTDLEARIGPLEEAVRAQKAEFRVMAAAEEPPHPSSGKGKLYAAGIPGASLGLLLAVLLAIELRGLRVQTAREAAFWINGPALGTSTWPRVPDALSQMLDEIADCAISATGNTLVIPASPGDEAAAAELSAGLKKQMATMTRSTDPGVGPRALIGEPSRPMERTTLAEIDPAHGIVRTEPSTNRATSIQTWSSTQRNVALRRASRLADRVVVVLTANTLAMPRLAQLRTQLGRDHGVGIIVIGIDPALADLPDRVGDVDGFWFTNDYEDVG